MFENKEHLKFKQLILCYNILFPLVLLTATIILQFPEISWASAFSEVKLESGEGKDHLIWSNTGACWSNESTSCSAMKINPISEKNGRNHGIWHHLISGPSIFYLRFKANSLGTNPKVTINSSDGSLVWTIFQVVGGPGSNKEWHRRDGSARLSIGWTDKTEDLKGPGDLDPSDSNTKELQLVLTVKTSARPALLMGILSLIQIGFLPGFILITALRLNSGIVKTWILSFSLSLFINHLVIILLVIFRLYRPEILYIFFVVEIVVLGYMTWPHIGKPFASLFVDDRRNCREFLRDVNSRDVIERVVIYIILAGAGCILMFFFAYASWETGKIFEGFGVGDSLVSYNRWALDWAGGNFPRDSGFYPQLIPSNWSLSYVFLGGVHLQFFPKALMVLFPVTTLLILLDLAVRTKETGYLVGLIVTGYLLRAVFHGGAFDGMTDVPVAFMSFAAVYCIFLSDLAKKSGESLAYLAVGAVIVSAASLTKQAGLYCAAIYPVLAYGITIRSSYKDATFKPYTVFLILVGLVILLSLPWYGYIKFEILSGHQSSNVSYLVGEIHKDRSIWSRMGHAVSILQNPYILGPVGFWLFIPFTMFLSMFHRVSKWIVTLIILPYFLIWALGFSYDERNLNVAVPFLGMVFGLSTWNLAPFCLKWTKSAWQLVLKSRLVFVRLGQTKTIIIIITAFLIIFGVGLKADEDTLVQRQTERAMNYRGDARVNRILYQYYQNGVLNGVIISGYEHLAVLPYLGELCIRNDFSDRTSLTSLIETYSPNWLLYHPEDGGPVMRKSIDDKIKAEKLRVLETAGGWVLVEIMKAKR